MGNGRKDCGCEDSKKGKDCGCGNRKNHKDHKGRKDKSCCEVIEDQALLWNDHVWYTTRFLVAAVNDLGEKDTDVEELLDNQIKIGANFGELFGKAAGDKLTELLVEHILIAAEIVEAAIAGDEERVIELQEVWSENGRQIAKFYSKQICTTKFKKLAVLWQNHLDSTALELISLIAENYSGNARILRSVLEHMREWSHYLSKSICKSFKECCDKKH